MSKFVAVFLTIGSLFIGFCIGTGAERALFTDVKTSSNTALTYSVQEVDAPPDLLLINSERWYLIATDFKNNKYADESTDGMTVCSDRKIYYRPVSEKTRIRVIIWHELIHASQCRPHQDDKDANWMPWGSDPGHHQVYIQGMFFSEFALANPDFMKWAANE